MRATLLPLLLFASLAGCDIVNTPTGETAGPIGSGGSNVTRKVLLEDCTGFRCNNCPSAAQIALDLKNTYGDRLVVVGVHMVNSFAEPLPGTNYTTDFRTPAGTAYEDEFDINALPIGLVNRKPYNGSIRVSRYSWSTAVAGMIDQEADLDLWIDTLTFDAGSNIISGSVKAVLLNPLNAPHNLTLYLTEDHVIDWQMNNQADPPDVENYDHRHVLRGALNSAWGEPFVDASAQVGDTLQLEFSEQLPDNVLEVDHCSVVAYVYSSVGNADQYEVKQVTDRQLVP